MPPKAAWLQWAHAPTIVHGLGLGRPWPAMAGCAWSGRAGLLTHVWIRDHMCYLKGLRKILGKVTTYIDRANTNEKLYEEATECLREFKREDGK